MVLRLYSPERFRYRWVMTKRQQLVSALLALVLTSACSGGLQSPTSPSTVSAAAPVQLTAVTTSALTSSVTVQGLPLNWELGEGCVFQKPAFPASFVGSEPTYGTRMLQNGNEIWGLWDDPAYAQDSGVCKDLGSDGTYSYSEVTTVRHYLVASFVKQRSEWRYCQWQPMMAVSDALSLGTCKDSERKILSEKLRAIE